MTVHDGGSGNVGINYRVTRRFGPTEWWRASHGALTQMQRAARAVGSRGSRCSVVQRAAGAAGQWSSGQRAAGSGQWAVGSGQRVAGGRRQEAGGGRRVTGGRRRAAGEPAIRSPNNSIWATPGMA
ncbi:hypothetical protein GGX14DRAFT_393407 [Mycena pura]|uniref:Uncharacterized protein n=1 Tax=Mycena pura TaxID=153505 RepID=A0AAD6VGT7_9AGAR|nr:hypothetical protein GGX14DRAFT_393407 [Mycena pura]